uniref:Uncharacterized protein n=1 Tax=Zea mays TaxID=4577 RepID=A0A804NYN0_MAIZE
MNLSWPTTPSAIYSPSSSLEPYYILPLSFSTLPGLLVSTNRSIDYSNGGQGVPPPPTQHGRRRPGCHRHSSARGGSRSAGTAGTVDHREEVQGHDGRQDAAGFRRRGGRRYGREAVPGGGGRAAAAAEHGRVPAAVAPDPGRCPAVDKPFCETYAKTEKAFSGTIASGDTPKSKLGITDAVLKLRLATDANINKAYAEGDKDKIAKIPAAVIKV